MINFAISSILILGLFGCTELFSSAKKTEKIPEVQIDYFQKKKMCSEFVAKENMKWEKSNLEGSEFAFRRQGEIYDNMFLDFVCYSKKRNTCVGTYNIYVNKYKNNKSVTVGRSYSAIDLLTNNLIDTHFEPWNSSKGSSSSSHSLSNNFYVMYNAIRKGIDCVD